MFAESIRSVIANGWKDMPGLETCDVALFYTSFGGVEDFQNPTFQRLIVNALFWTAQRDVAEKPAAQTPPPPKP